VQPCPELRRYVLAHNIRADPSQFLQIANLCTALKGKSGAIDPNER
jgi:hypothetical protein